jgi:hypothetical protein
MVNYCAIFITLAPGVHSSPLFNLNEDSPQNTGKRQKQLLFRTVEKICFAATLLGTGSRFISGAAPFREGAGTPKVSLLF